MDKDKIIEFLIRENQLKEQLILQEKEEKKKLLDILERLSSDINLIASSLSQQSPQIEYENIDEEILKLLEKLTERVSSLNSTLAELGGIEQEDK